MRETVYTSFRSTVVNVIHILGSLGHPHHLLCSTTLVVCATGPDLAVNQSQRGRRGIPQN